MCFDIARKNKMKTDTNEKKKCKNRHPPPSNFQWKRELALMQFIKNTEGTFNIKAYSRNNKIPRTSVYDILNRLIQKGYIEKPCLGNHILTNEGIHYLDNLGGVETSRKECRSGDLSTHYFKYKLPISEKRFFSENRIKELNPLDIKTLKLMNLTQHYIYFSDSTIIINPKQVIIRVHDIVAEDTEEAHFQAFSKAIGLIYQLDKIGLKIEGIELEKPHYARVNSILADSLKKIDDKYFLDLGNGKKFWIDYSKDKEEDETNDSLSRERLDQFLKDIMNNDVNTLDIDKIVKSLGFLTKIEVARTKREIRPFNGITPEEKPDYFG